MIDRRTVLAGGAALGSTGVAGCLGSLPFSSEQAPLEVTSDWPRVEFDAAATGQNPDVTGPTDEPTVQWTADIPVADGYVPATVVADGTVYVAGGAAVTALDGADGTQLWQTQLVTGDEPGGGQGLYCSAAVGEDHVFVGTQNGLVALTKDGTKAWSHDVDVDPGYSGVFRSAAVVGDTVYFCTAEEREVCAYATDGDERWRYSLEETVIGGPAVVDDLVFVGDGNGIHALSTDGEHRWTADIGRCTVTPTATERAIYAASLTERASYLGAVDAETGAERWLRPSAPSVVGSPALFDSESRDDAYLAVPSWFGTVFVYDRHAGTVQWGAPLGSIGSPRFPAADGWRVYAAAESRVACFRPWMGRTWELEIDGSGGNVAVVDGAAFVASTAGRCYAIA